MGGGGGGGGWGGGGGQVEVGLRNTSNGCDVAHGTN